MGGLSRSWLFLTALLALAMALPAAPAFAAIPDSLKTATACTLKSPATGYSYRLCDDGLPPAAGRTPNEAGSNAVEVPAKYDGWEGLPARSADAASMPGADSEGNVALDVDVSLPTIPAPPGGYPMIVFMHGCCAGTKADWESTLFDNPSDALNFREKWHYNNAWFAARGYVVVNYTARGFRRGGQGSTGETQLDSRRFEINDFQHLAGQIADDPFFDVNPRKIVPTGGSYGGGFAWLALTDPLWTSPGGLDMKLAAAAPRYGWTDLVYSLTPNGAHFSTPDRLPAFDGSDSMSPFGIPKQSITEILHFSGVLASTFPSYIEEAFSCMQASEPFDTNPLCASTIAETLPSFIADRSAYYQNEFFERIRRDERYRTPIFNAATLTDPLFTPVENLRMSNRLQEVVPGYPIQQYFGDYQHFVQNKAKEWGDLCGADRHVCRLADYPGGDVNATPADLVRTGVNTRLNRFIDHYAEPPGNPSEARPVFDVTASLQICPQNASLELPLDGPGPTFNASSFDELAPYRYRLEFNETRTTDNTVLDLHSGLLDPLRNAFQLGGRCRTITGPAGAGVATYESEPLSSDLTMIGGTIVSIDYSATDASALQLNSRLYDVFPDGRSVMVDRGPRRVSEPSGTVTYQLHGNGWRFPAGHRIRIEITQRDDPYLKASSVPAQATITGARLRIPVREPQPPVREDYENASKFCKAQREFFGDQWFRDQYGTNKNGANAHGKCVSAGQ